MKKGFIKIVGLTLALLIAAFVFSGCNKTAASGDNTGDNTTTVDTSGYGNISPADNIVVPANSGKSWWDQFTRFSNYDTAQGASDNYADAATATYGMHDEGIGPWNRQVNWAYDGKTSVGNFDMLNIKKMAWLECMGDTRNYIVAVKKLPDGKYQIDQKTGTTEMIANPWNWDSKGPIANKSNANDLHWIGVASFVNNEPWLGDYVISKTDIPVPTYPDGKPATGYMDGGNTPDKAKIYDACASKDLNGNFIRFEELFNESQSDFTGRLTLTDSTGKNYPAMDFSPGKDPAAPFWADYARNAAAFMIKNGVDGFWFDNWTGWDNIRNRPVTQAFGDWSEAGFKQYIKKFPQLGIKDPDKFSITDYVKNKFNELNPGMDNTDLSYNNSGWINPEWINDPIWRAYLAYKAETANKFNEKLYDIVKDEAKKAGKNPDDIAVTGNDFPLLTYDAFRGKIDICHTEYSPEYSGSTMSSTAGYPPNSYSGGLFNLLQDTSKSKNASIWYYSNKYPDAKNLALVLSYEALSCNITINSGNGISNVIGTDLTAMKVNKSIGLLKKDFGERRRYAEIGVVYSGASEFSALAPGGFIYGTSPTDISYLGWCHAFDELNIPYKCIQEFNLADRINSLNVLILPNMRVVSKNTVDKVLKPFLDRGGVLIVTGEDAGSLDDRDSAYTAHGSNLLVDLAKSYKGKGKTIYYDYDPTMDYYKDHTKLDDASRNEALKPIKDLIDGLYKEGRANNLLEITGLADSAICNLSYDPKNNTYMADVVNMQLAADTDTLTPHKAGVKLRMRLPSKLWGKNLDVKVFNAEKQEFTKLTNFKVDKAYIEVTLDAFDIYRSVVIKEKK